MHRAIACSFATDGSEDSAIADFVRHALKDLEQELAGTIKWYSQNAMLVPGSLKFISLESLPDSRYKLTYSYRWNVFNPCLDIDETEETIETVNVSLTHHALIFDLIDTEQSTVSDEL